MNRNKKNKQLRKLLAAITRPNYIRERIKEKGRLEWFKKSPFYRRRTINPSELIKPKNKQHRKQLKKEIEAFGIKVLV